MCLAKVHWEWRFSMVVDAGSLVFEAKDRASNGVEYPSLFGISIFPT